jgi:hypothetical protein
MWKKYFFGQNEKLVETTSERQKIFDAFNNLVNINVEDKEDCLCFLWHGVVKTRDWQIGLCCPPRMKTV